MIDKQKFADALKAYKDYFPIHWEDEKYKWEAIKCFQDNWDINAPNFAEMFDRATAKTGNLLASQNNFPKGMIINFSKVAPEKVRDMFKCLYDESVDLSYRMTTFQKDSEELRMTYGESNWKQHYQNTNSISTYLWLRYPDTYYIYKYSECLSVATEFESELVPKAESSSESCISGKKLYDDICDVMKQDSEVLELMQKYIINDSDCYDDKHLRTMAIDFGYFINGYYKAIWKLSQGLLTDSENEILRQKNLACIALADNTDAKDDKRTFAYQSNDFQKVAQKGDYFYLCYGNKIVLYGQFDDDVIISADDIINRKGWVCRHYTVIAESVSDEKYSGVKTRWTPDYNSTFVSIPKNNRKNFENKIFKPYFENGKKPKIADKFNDKITYVSEIIEALKELGGIGHLKDICQIIEERELLSSIKTNENWKRNVSAELQKNCKTSKSYIESNPNLFYHVNEKRDGIWGLVESIPSVPTTAYTKEDFLSEVYMSEENLNRINHMLKTKKNIILQGAPGVGKTYAAKRIAYQFMSEKDENRICFVQFHQSYCYEDFISGYKPNDNGFEIRTGPFYNFCGKAKSNPDKPYFFIIDEINRGNISKIFGELLMLIEADKRNQEITISDGTSFSVPDNLYIIGMMNTADRSLAMIDYALRRRFSFVTFKPAFDNDSFKAKVQSFENDRFNKLTEVISRLNEEIKNDVSLGSGFMIGHSYFCVDNDTPDIDLYLKNVVEYEIIPLLEEYWFDNVDKITEWSKKLTEAVNN